MLELYLLLISMYCDIKKEQENLINPNFNHAILTKETPCKL